MKGSMRQRRSAWELRRTVGLSPRTTAVYAELREIPIITAASSTVTVSFQVVSVGLEHNLVGVDVQRTLPPS
jgi:hypothetical protein